MIHEIQHTAQQHNNNSSISEGYGMSQNHHFECPQATFESTPIHRGLLGVPRLPTFWPIAGLGKLGRESFRARSKRLAETLPTILYTS